MDPKNKQLVEAHARVKVVLEFYVGVWGDDCPVQQVFDQASEVALGRVRAAFPNANPEAFQIIGTPVVEAIFSRKSGKGE